MSQLARPIDSFSEAIINETVVFPYTTTTPTYTGKQGERIIYFDATDYWLYVYLDGAWRTFRVKEVLTTKGDLLTFGTTTSRLAVGTNGQVLTADSTQSLGIKWADGGSISRARAFLNTANLAIDINPSKINFNAETYDGNNEFDSTTNYRFVATSAGRYLVTASVLFGGVAPSAGDTEKTFIYVNGSSVAESWNNGSGSGNSLTANISDILNLAVNDYIEIFAQRSNAACSALSGSKNTWVSIHKLS